MSTFNFHTEDLAAATIDARFLPLGMHLSQANSGIRERLRQRILHRRAASTPEVWGTLGWKDDRPFQPDASIAFSEIGNDLTEKGVTLRLIKDIYASNGQDSGSRFHVRERYINLHELRYPMKEGERIAPSELPRLRLCLLLDPGEQALVYYQHSPIGNRDDEHAFVEFILCPSGRGATDRQDYDFPLVPERCLSIGADGRSLCADFEPHPAEFIIKILTYKPAAIHSHSLLHAAIEHLNRKNAHSQSRLTDPQADRFGAGAYALLRYTPESFQFEPIKQHDIRPRARTLLLLHGTFSSTRGSFKHLYGTPVSLMQQLIDESVFEQVLAFNHDTVLDDIVTNASALFQILGDQRFEHGVCMIGTSRGALLAKYLSHQDWNAHFTTDRILTFSAAFGVGYFTAAEGLSRGLSVLRMLFATPAQQLVCALAQLSVESILRLPGLDAMNPTSERLQTIAGKPYDEGVHCQCIQADWIPALETNDALKPMSVILDGAVKLLLGRRHDWVVGFEEQAVPQHNGTQEPKKIHSLHVRHFKPDYARKYPSQGPLDTHQLVFDFFYFSE